LGTTDRRAPTHTGLNWERQPTLLSGSAFDHTGTFYVQKSEFFFLSWPGMVPDWTRPVNKGASSLEQNSVQGFGLRCVCTYLHVVSCGTMVV
jgi:hypothetical protein